MKQSEFKAIRAAGVSEFAIYPITVAEKVPRHIADAAKRASVQACPNGLLKATVIEDSITWTETFTLACGDTEYERPRRGGVLVELSYDKTTMPPIKALRQAPQRKVLRRDGGTRVQMVVSVAVILAPWNEYELVVAEREKIREAQLERAERLAAVSAAIGALDSSNYARVWRAWNETEERYDVPPRGSYDYSVKNPGVADGVEYLRGEVVLSLRRAEEIVRLLAARP